MMNTIVIDPQETATGAVFWLHGLGADGNDFVPAVPYLGLADLPLRFIFPNAPVIPVTINGGMLMPAWYDILSMGASRRVDEAQLQASAALIERIITTQVESGIPRNRIVLLGFSQGGAVACHVACQGGGTLAGLAMLSTYRINAGAFPIREEAKPLNLFSAHGDYDEVVFPALGRGAFDSLNAEGAQGSWRSYPMAHEVCIEELAELGGWIRSAITAPAAGVAAPLTHRR